ncbi:hypothetical protein KOEU_30030 [Komagataeibacter europaeus]|uniref:Uncharacterized protein n=1 Tax=Komagataeibacter europaeus TaxID=33995 RepID=A0A0M0EE03_KOMEU|nr:hypothetical protein KOEU_30030 [Komagataeibacter europaeus]
MQGAEQLIEHTRAVSTRYRARVEVRIPAWRGHAILRCNHAVDVFHKGVRRLHKRRNVRGKIVSETGIGWRGDGWRCGHERQGLAIEARKFEIVGSCAGPPESIHLVAGVDRISVRRNPPLVKRERLIVDRVLKLGPQLCRLRRETRRIIVGGIDDDGHEWGQGRCRFRLPVLLRHLRNLAANVAKDHGIKDLFLHTRLVDLKTGQIHRVSIGRLQTYGPANWCPVSCAGCHIVRIVDDSHLPASHGQDSLPGGSRNQVRVIRSNVNNGPAELIFYETGHNPLCAGDEGLCDDLAVGSDCLLRLVIDDLRHTDAPERALHDNCLRCIEAGCRKRPHQDGRNPDPHNRHAGLVVTQELRCFCTPVDVHEVNVAYDRHGKCHDKPGKPSDHGSYDRRLVADAGCVRILPEYREYGPDDLRRPVTARIEQVPCHVIACTVRCISRTGRDDRLRCSGHGKSRQKQERQDGEYRTTKGRHGLSSSSTVTAQDWRRDQDASAS